MMQQQYQPRYYQQDAVDALFNYFASGNKGNPLVTLYGGLGKSVIPPIFIKRTLERWPDQRFLSLVHVKELVKQNASKMSLVMPGAAYGVYSAGLNKRDTFLPIIFASTQSVYDKIEIFGPRNIVFIDECHLCSPKDTAMYQTIKRKLLEMNPYTRFIGLTATDYRLGMGRLVEDNDDGSIFTDIAYDGTKPEDFIRFVQEGYLARPVPRSTDEALDVEGVGISGGDFVGSALERKINTQEINFRCLSEACRVGSNRRSWIVFAAGIQHAEDLATMLCQMGVPAAAVHTRMPQKLRDKHIENFQAGKLRAIVNRNILTTGFDHPPIDMIIMMRPTLSAALWVQMLSRGTRPAPGKVDCLVLDYARNRERLGPINDPVIPRKPGQKAGGPPPTKICPHCSAYNHASARQCDYCGFDFPFDLDAKFTAHASTSALVRDAGANLPIIEDFQVEYIQYMPRDKYADTADPLKGIVVMYHCGAKLFKQTLYPFHPKGLPRKEARTWWRKHAGTEPPETFDEWMRNINRAKRPSKVRVWTNHKLNSRVFPKVMDTIL